MADISPPTTEVNSILEAVDELANPFLSQDEVVDRYNRFKEDEFIQRELRDISLENTDLPGALKKVDTAGNLTDGEKLLLQQSLQRSLLLKEAKLEEATEQLSRGNVGLSESINSINNDIHRLYLQKRPKSRQFVTELVSGYGAQIGLTNEALARI